jgi:hypothetical protein
MRASARENKQHDGQHRTVIAASCSIVALGLMPSSSKAASTAARAMLPVTAEHARASIGSIGKAAAASVAHLAPRRCRRRAVWAVQARTIFLFGFVFHFWDENARGSG